MKNGAASSKPALSGGAKPKAMPAKPGGTTKKMNAKTGGKKNPQC